MRVQLRIVAGSLKGRKIQCEVSPALRPTPQMVREALFSILGNAIPDRPFYDVFAGTGIIGLEAGSRGASAARFVERDFRLTQDIERNLRDFKLAVPSQVIRTDAYRWAGSWLPPLEPINLFLSPPFRDLTDREEDFLALVETLRRKIAPASVLVIQSEKHKLLDGLPDLEQWDVRSYGRNMLLFWVKEEPRPETNEPNP